MDDATRPKWHIRAAAQATPLNISIVSSITAFVKTMTRFANLAVRNDILRASKAFVGSISVPRGSETGKGDNGGASS